MKDEIVASVLREMMPLLDAGQSNTLKETLRAALCAYDIRKKETALMRTDQNGQNYLQIFLESFRQNGKSEGTIEQYRLHLSHLLAYLGKNVEEVDIMK